MRKTGQASVGEAGFDVVGGRILNRKIQYKEAPSEADVEDRRVGVDSRDAMTSGEPWIIVHAVGDGPKG